MNTKSDTNKKPTRKVMIQVSGDVTLTFLHLTLDNKPNRWSKLVTITEDLALTFLLINDCFDWQRERWSKLVDFSLIKGIERRGSGLVEKVQWGKRKDSKSVKFYGVGS